MPNDSVAMRRMLIDTLADRGSIDAAARAAASAMPDGTFVVRNEAGIAQLTLDDAMRRAPAVAAGMASLGIGRGDVVAVQLPQSVELVLCFAAAARLGAVLLTMVPALGPNEIGFMLRQSRARLYITPTAWRGADCRKRLADAGEVPDLAHHVVADTEGWASLERADLSSSPSANVDPDDETLLIYTSGTTGTPKGVRHSHRSLLTEVASIQQILGDRGHGAAIAPWPSGHIAGALVVYRFLLAGMTVLCLEHWDAGVAVALIESHRAVQGTGTPFHLTGLLDAAEASGRDISSLRDFQVGAAPVPSKLVARCAERNIATYRSYGSTEHPTSTYGSPLDPLEKRLTTEGRIVPGVDLRTIDDHGALLPAGVEGEIVSRGPDRFLGYRDASLDAEALLPGGWFRTGDVGFVDADGYLVLTDRKKDIIIRGGENISSKEVENHLTFHPAVAEVAVVAAPDERMGEVVCAFVVVRPGIEITLPEIGAWMAQRKVARFKTPERLRLVGELPRNATGKVLKHVLRDRMRAEPDIRAQPKPQ